MEWLNPLATVAAGGLVAWSIRKTLCDGRTLKVKEYEAVLGSSDEELKKTTEPSPVTRGSRFSLLEACLPLDQKLQQLLYKMHS